MDESQHLYNPGGHSVRLLRADMLQDTEKFQRENFPGALLGAGGEALQVRAPALPRQQREADFQSKDPHSENDFCGGPCLYRVLDPFLLSPDVVCVGSCCPQ